QAVYLSGPGGTTPFYDAAVYNNQFINCNNACGSKRLFQGLIYTNNHHEGCNTGVFTGEADTSNLPGKHNVIANNIFSGTLGISIISRISDHDVITGNALYNCQASMIAIEGSSSVLISDNVIYIDPTVYITPSSQYGITIVPYTFNSITYNSTNNVVCDNVIDGSYYGIHENDSSQTKNKYLRNYIVN